MSDAALPPIRTRDLRVVSLRPLLSPALLMDDLPLDAHASQLVTDSREEIVRILNGDDDRLLVVVGPCSVHDCTAALEYARRLVVLAERLAADLRIVMRVYFEKPRTTVGWKGLITYSRRARTASASVSRTASVVSQPIQASVMLWP